MKLLDISAIYIELRCDDAWGCMGFFAPTPGTHAIVFASGRLQRRRRIMARPVSQDQLVIIPIQGLHSHRCEQTIRHALSHEPGVNEVEVDFLSGQCSILFDAGQVPIARIVELIRDAGYTPNGYTRSNTAEE
jgi:copper chaperone CopZ